ncbi:MAG: type II toxin-antitoxin system VapC family toxin [Roseimicrobium sp.]
MRLLLDTCTFLWLALSHGKLSAEATRLINAPTSSLYLSDVSIWEVCMKHSAGKLSLPGIPRDWMPSRMAFFGVAKLALESSPIYLSGVLPRVHSDPFDRLLAAQAIESGLTILSPDTPLSSLGASRIW